MDNFSTQRDAFMKAALESGKTLEALNSKFWGNLSKTQTAFCEGALETAKQWACNFEQHKALPELFDAQSKLAGDYSTRLMATSRETTDMFLAAREDYKGWFAKGFQFFTTQAEAVMVKPVVVRKAA